MKKSLLIILAGSVVMIYACSDKAKPTDESTNQATEQSAITQDPLAAPVSNPDVSAGAAEPVASPAPTVIQNQSAPVSGATTLSTNQGPLNPAHGEPGHRCDIAVGAPLSSAPAAQPTPGTTSLPTSPQGTTTQKLEFKPDAQGQPGTMTAPTIVSSPSTTPVSGTTAPGMNPPHGEPGHDCAIPVGSPLKK